MTMKSISKRALSLVLVLVMCLSVVGLDALAVSWPSSSNIKTYVLSTGNNTTVYKTASYSSKYGTIYASDLITIIGYSGSWLKVTYPVKNGTKTGYIPVSAVTTGSINNASGTFRASQSMTAYRRSSGSATIGSVSKNDLCYILATSGSRTQVIYPISGGYKIGWVVYTTPQSTETIGCVDSAVSNANCQITVAGWALTKNSSRSLDVHVYVGGPAGSGAPGYAITANVPRPDVNNVYASTNRTGNYGFNSTITVPSNYAGTTQTLYFYAIGSNNPQIGTKTVTIKGSTPNQLSWQWPVSNYTVTQAFGHYSSTMAKKGRPYHSGMDLVNDISRSGGHPDIYAAAAGTVKYKGFDSGNGNHVILEHNMNGTTIYSLYSHLSSYDACPSVGSTVTKGQVIGKMGSTGNSTGTHLHFGIMKGYSENPLGYTASQGQNQVSANKIIYYNPQYVIQNGRIP